jgi:iron complex transport system substrate-binding protein
MTTEVTSTSPRIVSLLASGTELLCALGLGDHLVGRSHECDDPEWVKALPAVSRPTFDITGTSAEVDARVRARLAAGAPLYEVDEALLATLAPDVLITQSHCEVCAVSPGDFAHGVRAKLERKAVVELSAATLDGILDGFVEVAKVVGRPESGADLVRGIRSRLAALRERTATLPKLRVVCLEWVDPVFAMGNWGPELVEIAGGQCLLGRSGEHSTTIPWTDVVRADPDVLVVAPCGYSLTRALEEMPILTARAEWPNLACVRAGRVYVADGNRYFNRSGPALFETADILAEMIHPDSFAPRHDGSVWTAWNGIKNRGTS